MFRRNSKWIGWVMVLVVAVCLFGPTAVSYGSGFGDSLSEGTCNPLGMDTDNGW